MTSCTLIIAEDEPIEQIVMAREIRRLDLGNEIHFANDGEEALALLHKFDDEYIILLSDINMPRMNGFELVREVQQTHPDVPVLLLSSSDLDTDAQRARDAGAIGFIQKRKIRTELPIWAERLQTERKK